MTARRRELNIFPRGHSLKRIAFSRRLALSVLLLVLAISAALATELSWRVILFPYPVDYGEGPLLDQAVRWAELENVYATDLAGPPFTVANYPPLYAIAQAPWVAVFGPAFWYGRLLS